MLYSAAAEFVGTNFLTESYFPEVNLTGTIEIPLGCQIPNETIGVSVSDLYFFLIIWCLFICSECLLSV